MSEFDMMDEALAVKNDPRVLSYRKTDGSVVTGRIPSLAERKAIRTQLGDNPAENREIEKWFEEGEL
jgi:hypothetical protein